MSACQYRGHSRRCHVSGSITEPVRRFVERCYRNGWRWLSVTDETGEEVGSIVAHPDTGRRVWWVQAIER
jgi:hypothetical protein